MRKSLIYGVAVSALALTACSNDDLVQVPVDSNAISFAVTNGVTTRAAGSYCNTNMPASFNVAAQFHGQSGFYFEKDAAVRNGSSTIYTTTPERWWPEEGALDFHAWTNDDDTYAFDATQNKAQFVNFAPKAAVAQQLDLLYGVAMNHSREDGNVKLNFRHALSQIVFSARSEATTYNMTISSVAIGHLNSQGTFTFGGASTTGNYENHTDTPNGNEGVIKGGAGSWTLKDQLAKYTTAFDKKTIGNTTVELTGVNHQGGADGSLLLLPQTQNAWVPGGNTGAVADADGFKGAYFLLDVELTNDNNVTLYDGLMAVPVDIEWEQGTRYRYTFVFTDGNGGWTPDPNDPKPVLGGIKYDVTTDDFVPVDGGDKYPGEDPRPDADKYFYTLSFDANGGAGEMESSVFSNIASASQTFVVPECTFTSDYTFTGWNTEADGSGQAYIPGAELTITGEAGENVIVTLYAQWEESIQFVDLGLPSGTLWADRNLGATSVEDAGGYYQYGALKPLSESIYDNPQTTEKKWTYDYDDIKATYLLGYTYSISNGKYIATYDWATIENNTNVTKCDVITTNFGAGYHLPNPDNFYELVSKCTWKQTSINGVTGYQVIGPNNNSIFIPQVGALGNQKNLLDASKGTGYYWLSWIDMSVNRAVATQIGTNFNSQSVKAGPLDYNQFYLPIRGVKDSNN